MTGVMLIVCMCGGDAGFDGTVMSSVNSMKQFQTFFGLSIAEKSTGIVFGMYTVCAFFPTSILPDRVGRRWSMWIGNLCLCVGALLTGLAQNFGMFIAGRFLTGLGCTLAASSAKAYMSEVTSPATRGRWMGLLNSFYYVGQLLASGIAIPFGRQASDWAWRTPLLLQCVPAFINVLGVLFISESPRWLYSRGRHEEAIKVLAHLHSRDRSTASPIVQLQIQEFEENISLEGADKRWWDFRAVLRTSAHRYRFGLCCIIAIWGTLSGNGLITYFLPVLLLQAGITDPDRQRVLNFVNSVTSFIAALTGTSLSDKIGRRKLLLFAEIACACGMAIVAGLLSGESSSPERATTGIVFIYLFMVCYSFGYTPLQGLYPAECLAYENRAKGLALQTWVGTLFGLINTFGMPVALPVLTWKTYLIFMVVDIVGVVVIYLFAVETKQLSLEDLDHVFTSAKPKQTSFDLAKAARERMKLEKAADQRA
ncbi:general substrate transporter [Dioszegia hungarica]|uniref:General substrate transporter n=1 Tax=Dioszegia hungarica TaxID=4972 RepID=A0AA38LUE7_9TREE|nr:general substrate transporter [Dioszegia hungarica]KAI9637512.1 general substrate transporter [Dioszegia hungarica]